MGMDFISVLGRRVGLDLSYLFANGFWVILRYGITALLGLALTIGFAHLASKELYGQYQFVLSIISLFSVLSLPGFNTAALKAVSLGYGAKSIQKVVRLSFLSSLFAAPLLIGYSLYAYFLGGRASFSLDVFVSLVVGALLVPFFYAPNTWYVAYEGKSLFRPVTIRIAISSFLVTFGLLSVLYFGGNLPTLVVLYFGLPALLSWIFYGDAIRFLGPGMKGAEADGIHVGYGLSVTVQKFILGLSESVPPILLSRFFGFEFLAIFQIANYFLNTLSGVVSALASLYLPRLFRFEGLMHRRILLQSIVAGFISLLVPAAFLEIAFPIIYGDEYSESYRLAWLLLPLLVIFPLRIYLVNFFTAQAKNVPVIAACLISNLCGIAAFLFLKDGGRLFASAAYVYSLSLVVVTILLPIYFFRDSKKTDSI